MQISDYKQTLKSLHSIAKLVGLIRRLNLEHVTNYLELGMKLLPEGLSSEEIPNIGEFILDFKKLNVVYKSPTNLNLTLEIENKTQQEILIQIIDILKSTEVYRYLRDFKEQELLSKVFEDLKGKQKGDLFEIYADEKVLKFDAEASSSYVDSLNLIFNGISDFKFKLTNPSTPLVVWPEHFDLSTLIFLTENEDESSPHINFGFAPYSDGFELPYFYAYVYPYPKNKEYPKLPEDSKWHFNNWTGIVVDYEKILEANNPEKYVSELCGKIFGILIHL